MLDLRKEYEIIQTKINKLEKLKQPVDRALRVRQMEILRTLDDEFVKNNEENIYAYTARIQYNTLLKHLAKKLNLPIYKYVENLKILSKKMGI